MPVGVESGRRLQEHQRWLARIISWRGAFGPRFLENSTVMSPIRVVRLGVLAPRDDAGRAMGRRLQEVVTADYSLDAAGTRYRTLLHGLVGEVF